MVYVNGEGFEQADCADAQADLNLRFSALFNTICINDS